jgi:hypothetical protein
MRNKSLCLRNDAGLQRRRQQIAHPLHLHVKVLPFNVGGADQGLHRLAGVARPNIRGGEYRRSSPPSEA